MSFCKNSCFSCICDAYFNIFTNSGLNLTQCDSFDRLDDYVMYNSDASRIVNKKSNLLRNFDCVSRKMTDKILEILIRPVNSKYLINLQVSTFILKLICRSIEILTYLSQFGNSSIFDSSTLKFIDFDYDRLFFSNINLVLYFIINVFVLLLSIGIVFLFLRLFKVFIKTNKLISANMFLVQDRHRLLFLHEIQCNVIYVKEEDKYAQFMNDMIATAYNELIKR